MTIGGMLGTPLTVISWEPPFTITFGFALTLSIGLTTGFALTLSIVCTWGLALTLSASAGVAAHTTAIVPKIRVRYEVISASGKVQARPTQMLTSVLRKGISHDDQEFARFSDKNLPQMIDTAVEDQRSPLAPEQVAAFAKRSTPTIFIVDRTLRVLYFRADPAERRKDLLPLEDGSLPPAVEYTVLKLLAQEQEPADGVWRAGLTGAVAVRVVKLAGRRTGGAYAITVERVGVRDQLLAVASRYGLSTRERQVLNLVVKGLRNEEIAESLCISKSTAIFHVKQLLTKTGSRNRTEIVAKIIG